MQINKIKSIFDQIFQSFPSLAGKNFDRNLYILKKYMPFKIVKFKSGSKCLDWIIPKCWNTLAKQILEHVVVKRIFRKFLYFIFFFI